ncbi:MAG: N-acetylmuramoyl-L-alanine amidase [Candidatus Omnitrophica bacterium]|nr:N-acetylmuramoyl-L-alanine amidase [Candidatus Omnitrophota bacterium]
MKKLISVLAIIFLIIGCETAPKKGKVSFLGLTRSIDDTAYISAADVIKNYNLEYEWDTFTRKLVLKKGSKEAVFVSGCDTALVDDKCLRMQACAKMQRGEIMIPASFVQSALEGIFLPPVIGIKKEKPALFCGKYAIRTIVIDAGHGGKDPGAISSGGMQEKSITLNISKKLKNYLQNENVDIFLTRANDTFISLYRRADIANELDADFFISIHVNASQKKYIDGIEVFYLSEAVDDSSRQVQAMENAALKYEDSSFDVNNVIKSKSSVASTLWDMLCTENRAESIELAECISEIMSKNLKVKNRGVKAAKFYVLKGAKMPSVLVEVGFLSNKKEADKLKDKYYQDKIAMAIADGILLYKERYEKTEGFTRR